MSPGPHPSIVGGLPAALTIVPRTNSKLQSDRSPGKPLRTQSTDFCDVNRDRWPTQTSTLSSGVAQTGPDALLDKRALEFRHRADDLEHQPTRFRYLSDETSNKPIKPASGKCRLSFIQDARRDVPGTYG